MRVPFLFLMLLMALPKLLAQDPGASIKIGYANPDYIFNQLPEAKSIETELRSLQKQLGNQIDIKSSELEKKYADYIASEKTMVEAVRINAQRELQLLQDNLEKFQQEAQVTFQKKHEQLIQPVLQRITTAISDFGREKGYHCIITQALGNDRVVLYADSAMDVSNQVLLKLGVTVKPPSK